MGLVGKVLLKSAQARPMWAGMSDDLTGSRSALITLLRAAGGTASERITRALEVLVEELHMESAFVGEFRDGRRVVTHAAGPLVQAGLAQPLEETLCQLIASGELGPLVPDTADDAVLAARPEIPLHDVRAYTGVPLRARGQVVGTLCCLSRQPGALLNERDAATLQALGGYIGELLEVPPAAAPEPVDLLQLSTVVADGHDLEGMARPLLQLIRQVTQLDSAFLSLVDWEVPQQRVLFALNEGELNIPEGVAAPWSDTLCRRALDEGRPLTTNVPEVWGDSQVGRALGIVTYLTVPVVDASGAVIGTLCGAGHKSQEVDARHVASMEMFARLVAGQMERETARKAELARMAVIEERMGRLRDLAERDQLTGLLNRGGIQGWLATALNELRPDAEQLAVAFIDLDKFKPINDTHGHAVGDEVLRRFASALSATGRPGDLYGRLGGDEFIVATMLPPTPGALAAWAARLRRAAVVEFDGIRATGSVGVVSVNEPELTITEVLHRADEEMYRVKAA